MRYRKMETGIELYIGGRIGEREERDRESESKVQRRREGKKEIMGKSLCV